MAVRLHLNSKYFLVSKKHFFITKYFSAQAPGYGVFLPIFALRLSLFPNWLDSKFKSLTRLDRHGFGSTDSVVGGAVVSTRFSAWVAGLTFTAFGAIASAAAADLPVFPLKAPPVPSLYDWSGFYVGGHLGYAWGNSNWVASGADGSASGSLNFSQGVDIFSETGSWNEGVQFGYNYTLKNRLLLGVEADLTFPSFQNLARISTGGTATYAAGNNSYTDTLFASGTVRARIGYAPGNWLFYATGGLAWTVDQITLAQQSSGLSSQVEVPRVGWAAGVGVEFPISGQWTGKVEYLFTDYGNSTVNFAGLGDTINSNLKLQEVRLGLNYQFVNPSSNGNWAAPSVPISDNMSFHGQASFVDQGYPAFRSAFPNGPQSLPQAGQNDQTFDLTLYAGFKLWRGPNYGSTRRLIKALAWGTPTGWPGSPARKPIKSARLSPTPASSAPLFVRPSISAVKLKKLKPTSTTSKVRRLRIALC